MERARAQLSNCLTEWISCLKKSNGGSKGGHGPTKTGKSSTGRPKKTEMTKQEKQVTEAWETGSYETYEQCDVALELKGGETKKIIHRIKNWKKATEKRSK